jgi:hypothetical protein
MKRLIAEWCWRVAILCILAVIAWELQRVHEDIIAPSPDEGPATAAAPDETQESLDAISDHLARLDQKVDAILLVMARGR